MSDQAERLRQLVGAVATPGSEMSSGSTTPAPGSRHAPCAAGRQRPEPFLGVDEASVALGVQSEFHGRAHSFLFTSGKGGVGTSNLVLNLAIALGEMSTRVVVVDGDIGLANLDLLGGFYPRYDLGDVLLGRCELADAVVPGPGGIQVVPGAHASRTSMSDLGDGANRLARELSELALDFDFVLIDAGSGLGPGGGLLARPASTRRLSSRTPEPTSLADAHAAISRFHQSGTRLACGARQPGRVGREARPGSGWNRQCQPPVQRGGGFTAGTGVRSGRSTRADGGSEPASVRDGVSSGRCVARSATNRPGRHAVNAASVSGRTASAMSFRAAAFAGAVASRRTESVT